MHRNKTASQHQFAMIPRSDIPRSSFLMQKTYKTAFDAGYLVPIMCEEVLPGDTFNVDMTAFARLATPLFPIMDNMKLTSFFFFVPNRLVWSNWKKFMGEQANPSDSISYLVPTMESPLGGYAINSLHDYFGLPTDGQVDNARTVVHSALPLRGYNLIWNEWFRDENLQNSAVVDLDDGPDTYSDYVLLRRGKRHDYFTSALPFLQKGTSVPLPLGSTAPVIGTGKALGVFDGTTQGGLGSAAGGSGYSGYAGNVPGVNPGTANSGAISAAGVAIGVSTVAANSGLIADLSAATAATINQIRQSFQIQKFLERGARGGTRYTEIVRSRFGVQSPDARLQRPEYLGGGTTNVSVNPIAQTSATNLTGGSTPMGNLAAMGTALAHNHGFTQSFTEHGYVFCLISVNADLTYQQGMRRHWARSTLYDFYSPEFCMLGEQAILAKEIYAGYSTDNDVFGYQERHAEYRYQPSEITGLMRSTAAGTIDQWHLAQKFTSLPALNSTFIQDTPPVSRIVAVGSGANGQQFLLDAFIKTRAARPMPMFSVPGLVDHF